MSNKKYKDKEMKESKVSESVKKFGEKKLMDIQQNSQPKKPSFLNVLDKKSVSVKKTKENDNPTHQYKNKILAETYKVIKKIGSGSFGKVYLGQNIKDRSFVAIKIEKVVETKKNIIKKNCKSPIFQEYKVYCLTNHYKIPVPKIYTFHQSRIKKITQDEVSDSSGSSKSSESTNDTAKEEVKYKYNMYLVMEIMGPSVVKHLKKDKKKVPLYNIYDFGFQALKILRQIHELGYVHRDLKPENFTYGLSQTGVNNQSKIEVSNKVHLIDFGLSKEWREEAKKLKMPNKGKGEGSIVGTARYMSINVHEMGPYTRFDDLESLAYILIYLHVGSLPWQGLNNKKKKKNDEKTDKKQHMNLIKNKKIESKKTLCDDLPKPLKKFMKYCWETDTENEPDYTNLISIFQDGMSKTKKELDHEEKSSKRSTKLN